MAVMLGTWSFAPVGLAPAWEALAQGAGALDAVVEAATRIELDPTIRSVGLGGLPDAQGRVSLDACVMEDPDRCGGVCALREHAEAAAIARCVMEKTIHVLLAGADADRFADREGFARRQLLVEASQREWERWRRDPAAIDRDLYKGWIPPRNVEERTFDQDRAAGDAASSHDTVGLLALDGSGRLAGACSTSGMAFKTPGRVGDSPIIGQGLYVDQRAGACCATGTGELVAGVCGSFLVVELMRQGASPLDAATAALQRIAERFALLEDHQVAFVALTPRGRWASAALRPGFSCAVADETGVRVVEPDRVLLG